MGVFPVPKAPSWPYKFVFNDWKNYERVFHVFPMFRWFIEWLTERKEKGMSKKDKYLTVFTVFIVIGLVFLMWWLSYSLPICAHLLGY